MMQTVAEKVLKEIGRREDDWCFCQKDFMDLASRDALDKAFSRLVADGKIRRIGRGLYDIPRYSEMLKMTLSPSAYQIAKVIARKHGWRILPTGAHAANMLNLSTQVPMKMVYQSDGPTKQMDIGGWTLFFKKSAPKDMASTELSGLVINALKYLGKETITEKIIDKLRTRFDEKQKRKLLEDARFGTDWIFEVIQKICREERHDG